MLYKINNFEISDTLQSLKSQKCLVIEINVGTLIPKPCTKVSQYSKAVKYFKH